VLAAPVRTINGVGGVAGAIERPRNVDERGVSASQRGVNCTWASSGDTCTDRVSPALPGSKHLRELPSSMVPATSLMFSDVTRALLFAAAGSRTTAVTTAPGILAADLTTAAPT